MASDLGNVANADIDPDLPMFDTVSVNNPLRQGMLLGKGDHHASVIVQHLHAYAKAVGLLKSSWQTIKGRMVMNPVCTFYVATEANLVLR